MKKISPRYLIYLMIALVLLILPFRTQHYEINMEQLSKILSKEVNGEYVKQSNKSDLRQFYHVNFDDVRSFILYTPATSMRVNEVCVLEAVDEKSAARLLEAVTKRKDNQYHVFEGYGMEQCELLKKAVLSQKGNYIIFIVGEDAKHIQSVIEQEVNT